MSIRVKVAAGSIGVGLVVMALKYTAYKLTGSVALYSDALETIVNVASSAAALVAVWFAAKPADSNHPYGHDKAEYFAAVLVGVMITLAAVSIFHSAWTGYFNRTAITYSPLGLGINALAAAINGIWATVLMRIGRYHRSPALRADAKHLWTDVVTSLGVLLGVCLVLVSGWYVLDPLLAALVGISVLWAGWQVVKESVSGLMDEAASSDVQRQIRELISDHGQGALEAHDLRTRIAGSTTFVDFHLVVPRDMSVHAAHDICDCIEQAIEKALPGSKVTIHIEPDNKAKHSGIVVL